MAGQRHGWIGAFLIALTASAVSADERPQLFVHVDNRAGVPERELAIAREHTQLIFREAGIKIEWGGGRFPMSIMGPAALDGRQRVALMLVNAEEDPNAVSSGCTLGFAVREPAVAYAFYNRIATLGGIHPIDPRLVLGRVIAHELGHVLLPPHAHSASGIMRSNLDLEPVNPDRFTSDQAQALRRRLRRGATVN
jgi:hypothetical protein